MRACGTEYFLKNGSAIMADDNAPDITALTVQLLSAFVSNNILPSGDLAGLVQSTRAALTNELKPNPTEPDAPTYTPAVSVRKSLSSPEHILSLIDGKPYKTLKRHLTSHGLTPEEYRARYSLPKSYPLVATSYSDARRAVASKIGLGRKPDATPAPAPEARPSAAAPAKAEASAKLAAPKKAVNGDAKAKPAKAAAAKTPAEVRTASVTETKPIETVAAPAKAQTNPKKSGNSSTKAKAGEAVVHAAAATAAPVAKSKAAPTTSRKRLSIAGPKDNEAVPAAPAVATPEVKDAAPKVKPVAKAKPTAATKPGGEKRPAKAAKAVAPAVEGDTKPKADAVPAKA